MSRKLWLKYGSKDSYRCFLPEGTEYISDIISLIRNEAEIKSQLEIPRDCGTIKLHRANGSVLSNGETIASFLEEDDFLNNCIHPIIVRICSPRGTSEETLFASGSRDLSILHETDVHKRQRLNVAVWKEDPPLIYSLEMEKMFFVNRSHAIEQLHKIHKSKYARASSSGVGGDWIIPLADNVIGLGKSDFGRHYINKSRELWRDVKDQTYFQKYLMACHTVNIAFVKGALSGGNFDLVMTDYLIEALKPMFLSEPDILATPPPTVDRFLCKLTRAVGPLFIVLDEIGAAFENDNSDDVEKRQRFLSFCSNVISKWLSLEKVFFLLLGRGSFLSYVGLRPVDLKLTPSDYKFERLNIHLLRKDAIRSILRNTRMLDNEEKTVQQHLGLDDEQLNEISAALFAKTNGHPRSLLITLRTCNSYSEIMEYTQSFEFSNSQLFHDALFRNRGVVAKLLAHLEEGSNIDLTQVFEDAGNKLQTYDIIANNSFISWEGTVQNARLYTHPFVKTILENFLLPFKEYIGYVGSAHRVSLDYPNVLEWMVLKRLQELFSTDQQPSKALPLFFDTPVFGNICQLSFSGVTFPFPKITSSGNRSADLESESAHHEDWKKLIASIDSLGNVCLKPRPKSASSDALLFSKAKLNNEAIKLTLGLAVKNYGSTEFTNKHLERECVLFNRMFNGTDCRDRKNVLLVCCTRYHKDLLAQFNGKLFQVLAFDQFDSTHEVILLDLTAPGHRSMFFGVHDALSQSVENVIFKPEVEFDI